MKTIALLLLPLLLAVISTACGAMGDDMAGKKTSVRDGFWSHYNLWPADEFTMGRGLGNLSKWTRMKSTNFSMLPKGFVSCGSGYCPSSTPICCGGPREYFCIPGGMSCCSAEGGTFAEACPLDGLCCASLLNATCCKSDEVCTMDLYGESYCDRDSCSTHHTADECFNGSESCKWCCSDRRCVSKPTQCKSKNTVISRGERCKSRCQYADTCNLCMSYNSNETFEEGSCAWCCSSQSCISAEEVHMCGSAQIVKDLNTCPSCQAYGSGINPHFVWTTSQNLFLLAVIVLPSAILTCFCASRGLFYLYRNSTMRDGMRVMDAEAHLVVRRYGFDVTAQVPRLSRPFSAFRLWGRRLFASVFRSKKISAEESGVPAVRGVLRCSACNSTLKLETLADFVNFMQKGKPKLSDEADRLLGREIVPKHSNYADNKAGDDNVVILFPCGHQFCYFCMGLETVRSVEQEACNTVPLHDETDNCREGYDRPHVVVDAGSQPAQLSEEQGEQKQGQEHLRGREQEREGGRNLMDANVPLTSSSHTRSLRTPQRASRSWKDKIFGSLRGGGKTSIKNALADKENREKILIEHIGKKCPTCREPVKDALFSESILTF